MKKITLCFSLVLVFAMPLWAPPPNNASALATCQSNLFGTSHACSLTSGGLAFPSSCESLTIQECGTTSRLCTVDTQPNNCAIYLDPTSCLSDPNCNPTGTTAFPRCEAISCRALECAELDTFACDDRPDCTHQGSNCHESTRCSCADPSDHHNFCPCHQTENACQTDSCYWNGPYHGCEDTYRFHFSKASSIMSRPSWGGLFLAGLVVMSQIIIPVLSTTMGS